MIIFSCSSSPFSSGTLIFCHTQTLVLYSIQLIHVSRTAIKVTCSVFRRTSSLPSFRIHITQCSTPTTWQAVSLVSYRSLPISVNCLTTCQAIASRTFISVELLLSVVTILLIRRTWIFQHNQSFCQQLWRLGQHRFLHLLPSCVFVALIFSPNFALM